ncbi:MAG: hypothetical protein KDA87_21675 [Planctomycetales bacterium]|nr:hypothetical protein [Planctomycetales bacterium]
MNTNSLLRFVLLVVAVSSLYANGQTIETVPAKEPNSTNSTTQQQMMVVVGAAGTQQYGELFATWALRWKDVCQSNNIAFSAVGWDDANQNSASQEAAADGTVEMAGNDRERLQQFIAQVDPAASEALWIVLIGHGTSYGEVTKFNLAGPDVAADDFAAWLKEVTRPVILVHCGASSGPFIQKLSGPNRIVVTATNSGAEQNFARFGEYLSAAIADLAADLDHDNQVSLLEAYLTAAANVGAFYQEDARLTTEHALLDDNGDGLGTPADFFVGIRAAANSKSGEAVDGLRAHQMTLAAGPNVIRLSSQLRAERDALEVQIEALRQQKADLPEDQYYDRLEQLLLPLARLYAAAEETAE